MKITMKRTDEAIKRKKEIGRESDEIIQAMVRACTIRPERYTILAEKMLDYNSAARIAKATGVID